jgi:CheY-like chemotaxis protein
MTPAPQQSVSPKRILVAEDEALVAHTIRMALAVDSHTVEIAQDGAQALEMFQAGQYDLVITDFRMPKMDGLELAEAIKRLCPAKPIILITAHLEAINARMGNDSNVDVLLGKPFLMKDLQAALGKVFPAG